MRLTRAVHIRLRVGRLSLGSRLADALLTRLLLTLPGILLAVLADLDVRIGWFRLGARFANALLTSLLLGLNLRGMRLTRAVHIRLRVRRLRLGARLTDTLLTGLLLGARAGLSALRRGRRRRRRKALAVLLDVLGNMRVEHGHRLGLHRDQVARLQEAARIGDDLPVDRDLAVQNEHAAVIGAARKAAAEHNHIEAALNVAQEQV